METKTLIREDDKMPSVFNNAFSPWNEWLDNEFSFKKLMRIPSVNISQQKDKYEVSFAIPGFRNKDIKIDVEGNMLTVHSEKEENVDEKGKKYARKEYAYSSFSRSFTLPEDVIQDKAEAKYDDGILTVSLPRKDKPAGSKTKQINVK